MPGLRDMDARMAIFREEVANRPTPEETYVLFKEALLLGHIAGDIRFLKTGDCEFTIRVPMKFTEHCDTLRYAIGVPLEIYMKVWDNDW